MVLQSFAHHRIPGSHTVPLRPSNVTENPAPLPSYPVLHNPYGSTEGTLQTISPYQIYGNTDWTHPHQPGTALAPTHYAGMAFATRPSIPTIPRGSIHSSAATILPSDHRIMRFSSQQRNTQELNPFVEYVAPSKGPMTGGVEVTIVGTNFPHTLPLSVYFSTKPAIIVSREYLAHDHINAEPLPDSKNSGDHTMFGSRYIISRTC